MIYFKYFSYVLRHKWKVFLACLNYGIIWQGITHDWSKFLPDEFIGYANYFYGDKKDKGKFDYSWVMHVRRSPHHWQHWTIVDENGIVSAKIPIKYMKEMVCDLIGVFQSKPNATSPLEWYTANKSKIHLHPDSRLWLEKELENGNSIEDAKQYYKTS